MNSRSARGTRGKARQPRDRNTKRPSRAKDELSDSEFRHFVVHCKKSSYDVYVGRRNPTIKDSTFEWGNPFKISASMNRQQVVDAYREWLLSKPELVEKAKKELRGKTLACWCSPKKCHGDVLAEVANSG